MQMQRTGVSGMCQKRTEWNGIERNVKKSAEGWRNKERNCLSVKGAFTQHQIVRSIKRLAKHFLTKVDQIFGEFLGYFEKHHFIIKNWHWSSIQKFGLLFITSGHTGKYIINAVCCWVFVSVKIRLDFQNGLTYCILCICTYEGT